MDETAKEGVIGVYPSSVAFVRVAAAPPEIEPATVMLVFGVPTKLDQVVGRSILVTSTTMAN